MVSESGQPGSPAGAAADQARKAITTAKSPMIRVFMVSWFLPEVAPVPGYRQCGCSPMLQLPEPIRRASVVPPLAGNMAVTG